MNAPMPKIAPPQIALDKVSLEAAEFGSQGSAVLGIRDSGKTYTATYLAEQLFDAGVPFVAFDPIGVWRFLRVPAAGRSGRGLPVVVAGGQAGDLPLTPATAPAIVEAAMREGVSLVLDLFHIDLSKADWKRIVRDCVRLLLHKNKPHGLRHVFLEEASEFAPQRVIDGDVYAEIEKLARMGGNARLGYTLINQRAEEVNKAVLELCDNLFLHRQKGRNSLVALSKWLDVGGVAGGREIIETLATLPTGECWAWSAGAATPVRCKVPAKRSLHPDRRAMRGDDDVQARPAVNVDAFVAALQAALPQLQDEPAASDPTKLRAKVAQLTRDLKAATALAEKAKAAEARRSDPVQASKAALTQAREEGYAEGFSDALEATQKALAGVSKRLPKPAAKPALAQTTNATPAALAPPAVTDGDLGKTQADLLRALAWWSRLGFDRPTRVQVAAVAGLQPQGSTLRARLSELNRLGLVEYPAAGVLTLTPAGAELAPQPEQASLHELVFRQLSTSQAQLLRVLMEHAGEMSREDLALACGMEPGGSTLRARISELNRLELVEYPRAGVVRAQGWVMEATHD